MRRSGNSFFLSATPLCPLKRLGFPSRHHFSIPAHSARARIMETLMERIIAVPVDQPDNIVATPPVSYVPTPSSTYRKHRKAAEVIDEPGKPHVGRRAVPVPTQVPP